MILQLITVLVVCFIIAQIIIAMNKPKQYKCPTCGEPFKPGYDGLLNPIGCDSCLGVKRDRKGRAWLPGETILSHEKYWVDEDITREDAFKNQE